MGARQRETAYARIARELVDAITRGDHRVGDFLPTENEIAAREGVSRHTAREALRRVESLGLVERRRGAGTRVKASEAWTRFQQPVHSIENLLAYGATTRLRLLRARRVRAPREVAALLGVAAGAPVVRVEAERLEVQGDLPLARTEAWVPAGTDAATGALLDRARSVPALLSRLDVARLARVEQVFSAALADARTGARLGCAAGAPLLVARRRYFGADGGLQLMAISTHRAERYSFTHVLVREPVDG
ncbi:MAG: GntR family transcriptional regulator [Xanthomonadaceae bacterium]|jgi:DNA-binding GntR family transcriptional regulator|nr:GntR family transcriptional regulator [Xanthomonadaceae bacterium]